MSWLLESLDEFPAWAYITSDNKTEYFFDDMAFHLIHLGWWCSVITKWAFPSTIKYSFMRNCDMRLN
jgi:hypothetical protein